MSPAKRLTDLTDEERAEIVERAFRPADALARYEQARDEEEAELERVQDAYDTAKAERARRRAEMP